VDDVMTYDLQTKYGRGTDGRMDGLMDDGKHGWIVAMAGLDGKGLQV
jgi:hypothetical protein